MSLLLEEVSKSFIGVGDDITNVLDKISFKVNKGEFICIVGPSGCGKSTILRLIAGLVEPTAGSIKLNDKNIEGTDSNRGMAFQKPTLFPWLTVEQNINFGLKMRGIKDKCKVDRMLKITNLEEFRKSYPHQLSGGMAQRVALVRTMVNEPEIFLLDEPLGALDAFTRMNMQDELLSMWKEKNNMMIMVTHDIDEAIYMGTRVIVMGTKPGKLLEDIRIDLAYPRNRTKDSFIEYRNKIMYLLGIGQNQTL